MIEEVVEYIDDPAPDQPRQQHVVKIQSKAREILTRNMSLLFVLAEPSRLDYP